MTVKETERTEAKMTGPKRRVGVVDFENKTKYGQARLGTAASDVLITELAKTGKFIVVEREKLSRLMEEQKLGMSGGVDPVTAARVGRILGLSAIVTGAVSQFGVRTEGSEYLLVQSKRQVAEATVDIRAVDVETGQVLYADSGKGRAKKSWGGVLGLGTRGGYDETLEGEALRAAIVQFVDNIVSQVNQKPWSCRVADVVGQDVYLNAGKASGLERGMVLSVFHLGRPIQDPDSGLVIGHTEEPLGPLEVVRFFGEDGAIGRMRGGRIPSPKDIARLAQ
ncbi:MAG: hypothetical protein HY402_00285 [Elusimicrobia bacterium]|nr:hypothetical protein [Elusimicrobiota bacterium]